MYIYVCIEKKLYNTIIYCWISHSMGKTDSQVVLCLPFFIITVKWVMVRFLFSSIFILPKLWELQIVKMKCKVIWDNHVLLVETFTSFCWWLFNHIRHQPTALSVNQLLWIHPLWKGKWLTESQFKISFRTCLAIWEMSRPILHQFCSWTFEKLKFLNNLKKKKAKKRINWL